GVERLELTERKEDGNLKYRRVDVQSGYLGYLAATTHSNNLGCIARVVGPGTPAALATAAEADVQPGLLPGDLIVAVGGKAISSTADFNALMEKTKPGDELSLEVVRDQTPLRFTAQLSEHPLDLLRLSSTGGDEEVLGNYDQLS